MESKKLAIGNVEINLIEYYIYRCEQCVGDIPCWCMTAIDCFRPTGCLYNRNIKTVWNLIKGDENGI